MPYCPKCGASVDGNSQFCSYCGSPVSEAAQNTPPPTSTPPPFPSGQASTQPMLRPTGVTILAILAGLGGLAAIASGLFLSMFGIGFVIVIFGLIEFAVAYGFWVGAPWGWWLGIIGAALDIISIFSLNVFGLVIGIIMLYYLTRPHVKAWFHEA